jgi:hypothetical protein
MREYSSKLVDIAENHAREIAVRWYFDVIKNPRTPSYHDISEQDALPQAEEFYRHFRDIFLSEKPYETARQFFSRYAEARYREGVPSSEAIYVLVLMRRHIWLYSDFHITFVTADERKQAIESLNRMMLIFDYAVHVITEKYKELIKSRIVQKGLGTINALRLSGSMEKFRSSIMAILLSIGGIAVLFYNLFLRAEFPYDHLLYVPVVLAAIWWGKKGVSVAIGIGVYLIMCSAAFLNRLPADHGISAMMFFAAAVIIALLAEGIENIERELKCY